MITLAALPDHALAMMQVHALQEYPREACGVIFEVPGRLTDFAVLPCENVALVPSHNFCVGLKDQLLIRVRRRKGDKLVALYHSHCDRPAIFSDKDRHFSAAWPDLLHIVMAVTERGVLAMHAFDAAGVRLDVPVMEPA